MSIEDSVRRRHEEVMNLRIVSGLGLREIANVVGLSPERVRQIVSSWRRRERGRPISDELLCVILDQGNGLHPTPKMRKQAADLLRMIQDI